MKVMGLQDTSVGTFGQPPTKPPEGMQDISAMNVGMSQIQN